MRKGIIILAVILISVAFAYWDQVRVPSSAAPVAVSEPQTDKALIPNETLRLFTGAEISLHEYKGKILLLHFWATWCAPCVKEFPQLLDLAERYEGKVILLAVSVDKNRAAITRFLKKLALTEAAQGQYSAFVIAHDPERRLAQDVFQSVKYPETFMIAPDLTIHRKIVGETDWTGRAVQEDLERLLMMSR